MLVNLSVNGTLATIMSANSSASKVENSQEVLVPATDRPILQFSKDFMFFSLAGIIPLGLIFNTISVLVFLSRTMRKRSASLYLASLAVSDSLSLLACMVDYWLKHPHVDISIIKSSDAVCISISYLSSATRMFSALLVTSFTIERFIGVVYPLKRATLSSLSHARRVVIAEGMVSVVVTSFTVFTIGIVNVPYGHECDVRPDKSTIYSVFNVLFLVCGSIVVPIIVICSLNTFILRKICTRRANLVCAKQFSKRIRQGYNTATVLLSVSSAFVILNLPYCVTWFLLYFHHYGLIPSLGEGAFWKLYSAKYITSVPYYLNYSINFLLYNICARTFRQELMRLLCMPYQIYHLRALSRKRSSPTGGTKPTYLDSSRVISGQEVCQRMMIGHNCAVHICQDSKEFKSSVQL